jgi:hypothetical protein
MSRSGCGDFSNPDYGNAHNHGLLVSYPLPSFLPPLFRFSLVLVELILDFLTFRSLRGMFE